MQYLQQLKLQLQSMFLDKKIQNKYTIGKYLRKQKGLRKKDTEAVRIPLPKELKEYKQDLQKKGMKIAHMDLGLFQTKNGLKYSGFIATQDIPTNSVLLRVPVDCLLTTRDAFLSEIQQVFQQNPKFYAKAFSSDWQDRILLTYLLYQYQKGQKSRWFHLIRNLPKEIDYVVFWEDEELKLIEDQWVKYSILKQRQKVFKQQSELLKIAAKYPQFFDMKYFTRQNIQWIHVHLVTRCFGKYFQYTTMVPYAELFNHECTDVYYTMAYHPENPNNTHEELDPPLSITNQQADQLQSSDGSYNASDVSIQDQQFEDVPLAQPSKNTVLNIQSQVRSLESYLSAFINFNDGVSLPFLATTFQQMEQARKEENKQTASKRLQKIHSNNVKYLKLIKQLYTKLGYTTYTYGLRQKKKWKENPLKKQKQAEEVDPNELYFQGAWKKDKFDQFLMVCSSKDQYEQGSQVYFCYGRLPNRLLLMRYGISLEHNKYNHLFIRIDITQTVHSHPPLLQYIVSEIILKKYRKFKVKRTSFCCELLAFLRAMQWKYSEDPECIFYIKDINKQKRVLRMAQEIYVSKLQEYSLSMVQNQQLLKDKSIGYHQYFAIVYKLQQQRILHEQLKMIDYARQVLQSIQTGHKLQQTLSVQKREQKLRYQLMMSTYFKYFKFEFWEKLG